MPLTKNMWKFCFINFWLFIKGDIIIGEWGIFGVENFLCYSQFFVKDNFIIGGVECPLSKCRYFHGQNFANICKIVSK